MQIKKSIKKDIIMDKLKEDLLKDLEEALKRAFGYVELDVTVKVKEPYYEDNRFCKLVKERAINSSCIGIYPIILRNISY